MTAGPLRDPCLRTLCKICVSGYITRSVAEDHLQDPCLRILYTRPMFRYPCIHVIAWVRIQDLQDPCSGAVDPLQHACFRILYKIHASGPSRGPTRLDPCLRIYASASLTVNPRQDPCLRNPCKIHVSRSMSPHLCLSVRIYLWILRSMSLESTSATD